MGVRHAAQLHPVRGAISRRRLSKAAPWRLIGDSTWRTAASPSGSSSPQMHPAAMYSFSIGGWDGECWLPTAQLFLVQQSASAGGYRPAYHSTVDTWQVGLHMSCLLLCDTAHGAKCCAI